MTLRLFFFVSVLLAVPFSARGETEQYLGLGESMIPVDGAATTATVEPGQFFESFRGSHYYFRIREGYEGDLISMGKPLQGDDTSPQTSASVSASDSASAAVTEADAPPTVLGPYEIIGIYSYDTETGEDIGMDCLNPTITIIGVPSDRLFRLDCPHEMQM